MSFLMTVIKFYIICCVHYDYTIMLVVVFWNPKLINSLEKYNHSVEKKEKNIIINDNNYVTYFNLVTS